LFFKLPHPFSLLLLIQHTNPIRFLVVLFVSHSINAYEVFPDAIPFLNWANRHGLVCGVLSNADERYGDSVLPMLGLTHDELQFQCFSKDLKLEKPDARVFMAAMHKGEPFLATSEPIDPSCVLHIGNDFHKDFEGSRRVGMHGVLLDRYKEYELADEWRRRGAPVFRDLLDVVEFLGRSGCQLG
jgi:FMN phosphatase YigB (HAD superfamily)